jgi:hypothetical protein
MASTAIARPQAQTGSAFIKTFSHADMPTFTVGDRIKFGSGSDQLLAAVTGADVLSFGYVYQQNGDTVDVIMDGTAIIQVKVVASGTATRGTYAVMSATANQYQNAAAIGGATAQHIAGRFMNAGTDGDYVGLLVGGVNMATGTT